MPFSPSGIVPLGRLASVHGIRSGEFPVQIKADLFSKGGTVLRNRLQLFICRSDAENWIEVTLSESPRPMGGDWGKQSRVLLTFDKSIDLLEDFLSGDLHLKKYDFWVGVPRLALSDFLNPGEILAWDYLKSSFSERSRPQNKGHIVKVLDPYQGLPSSFERPQKSIVNLELLYENGATLVVPSSWILNFDIEKKHIEFEDLSEWESENSEGSTE